MNIIIDQSKKSNMCQKNQNVKIKSDLNYDLHIVVIHSLSHV